MTRYNDEVRAILKAQYWETIESDFNGSVTVKHVFVQGDKFISLKLSKDLTDVSFKVGQYYELDVTINKYYFKADKRSVVALKLNGFTEAL